MTMSRGVVFAERGVLVTTSNSYWNCRGDVAGMVEREGYACKGLLNHVFLERLNRIS